LKLTRPFSNKTGIEDGNFPVPKRWVPFFMFQPAMFFLDPGTGNGVLGGSSQLGYVVNNHG